MKNLDITTLRVFKLIYDTRSLTEASRIMSLSKPALSKRLEIFETSLGFKLFSRTTRSIKPTSEANNLILQVNEILERIEKLNTDLEINSESRKRKIKVTCNSSMAQKFVGKILRTYQNMHPGLDIELVVTDSVLDPVEHNIDLSIRVNPPKNSSLIGKKLGEYRLLIVANPLYLNKHKKIKSLNDLIHHDLLVVNQHMKELKKVKFKRSFETNDSPLVSQLILSGEGPGVRSSWDVKEDLKNKKLVLVLPKNTFNPSGDVWLLSTSERLQIRIVRELYDYVLRELSPFLNL